MTSQRTVALVTDIISPPGDTLLEALEERGMTQKELAQRTGRPLKTINEIVRGKGAITAETALQFERVLGISARFWLAREQDYRERLARIKNAQQLQNQIAWLKNFPVSKMIKQGWIARKSNDLEQLIEMLAFFGIASPNVWETLWEDISVAFRSASKTPINEYALAAWLQQGERQAAEIACQPYHKQRFQQTLVALRTLSVGNPEYYLNEIVRQCALAGVAITYVPETEIGVKTYGATYWLSSTKAVIQLSLRQKDDGHFWFTFFHEAGHIMLHGHKATFIEDDLPQNEQEAEADAFAAEILIPAKAWQRFLDTHPRIAKDAITAFAQELGIAPGIIVGRLQHEQKIPHADCNGLKQKIALPSKSPEDE